MRDHHSMLKGWVSDLTVFVKYCPTCGFDIRKSLFKTLLLQTKMARRLQWNTICILNRESGADTLELLRFLSTILSSSKPSLCMMRSTPLITDQTRWNKMLQHDSRSYCSRVLKRWRDSIGFQRFTIRLESAGFRPIMKDFIFRKKSSNYYYMCFSYNLVKTTFDVVTMSQLSAF